MVENYIDPHEHARHTHTAYLDKEDPMSDPSTALPHAPHSVDSDVPDEPSSV